MNIEKIMRSLVPVSVIVIVLVGGIIIPIIDTVQTKPDYWQYDDYKEISSNVDVDGDIFEIISIGNKQYIHAKDVGIGTIDGKQTEVRKAILDMAFITGQSNAAYWNPDPDTAAPVPKLGTSYYFGLEDQAGAKSGQSSTGGMDIANSTFWSMLDENGELRIGNKGPAYAAEYYEKTGHKVYWVCGAIGNKHIAQFLPAPEQGIDNIMWVYMGNILNAAIAAVDTDHYTLSENYYMWCQGEANQTISISSYEYYFMKMHNALLEGKCAGVHFKGCVISEIREQNGGNAVEAQRYLADKYSTIYMGTQATQTFTVANGLMGPDDLHYSQLGNNIIGSDLGKFIGKLVMPYENENTLVKPILSAVPIILIGGLIATIAAYFVSTRKY